MKRCVHALQHGRRVDIRRWLRRRQTTVRVGPGSGARVGVSVLFALIVMMMMVRLVGAQRPEK